jgi:hypothetical protein
LEFTLQAESQKIVNKHNTQKYGEFWRRTKTPGVKMMQYKQKIRTVFNKMKTPVGGTVSLSSQNPS